MTNIVTYPTNPVQGQEFTVGETIKIWDGEKWVNKTPTNNPHNVTKAQVGLGNVDDVSAANLRDRSTHTGTQTLSTISDAGSAASKDVGTANGVASLDGSGKVPDNESQVPSGVIKAQLIGQGLSGNYGFFEEGFTYSVEGDIGIDADGNSWIYVGAGAPNKVVSAGTVPSVSAGYERVDFNAAINMLRQDLANPDMGAAMVARGVVAVDSIADLLALPEGQRKEDLRYIVKGYHAGSDVGGGEFYWDSERTDESDGGTVFNGFVRVVIAGGLTPQMFGAVGDGENDDGPPLRSAVAAAAGEYEVVIPPGVYSCGEDTATDDYPYKRVARIPDNSRIRFIPGAKIECREFSTPYSSGLLIASASNVEIFSPEIVGTAKFTAHNTEFQFLINCVSSRNVRIHSPKLQDSHGDGINIGPNQWSGDAYGGACVDVIISKPVIKDCWRQGISITDVDGIDVYSPRISGISGKNPQAAIDIEADRKQATLRGIRIHDLQAFDCSGAALLVFTTPMDSSAPEIDVVVNGIYSERCAETIRVVADSDVRGLVTINNPVGKYNNAPFFDAPKKWASGYTVIVNRPIVIGGNSNTSAFVLRPVNSSPNEKVYGGIEINEPKVLADEEGNMFNFGFTISKNSWDSIQDVVVTAPKEIQTISRFASYSEKDGGSSVRIYETNNKSERVKSTPGVLSPWTRSDHYSTMKITAGGHTVVPVNGWKIGAEYEVQKLNSNNWATTLEIGTGLRILPGPAAPQKWVSYTEGARLVFRVISETEAIVIAQTGDWAVTTADE